VTQFPQQFPSTPQAKLAIRRLKEFRLMSVQGVRAKLLKYVNANIRILTGVE
jgi:hypothetical protein